MSRKLRKLFSSANHANRAPARRGTHAGAIVRAARACIEQFEPRIMLSTYKVTGMADGVGVVTGSGPFSATTLRAAINAANTAGGSNTINLFGGTYSVNDNALGELLISSDIDLEGAGSAATIIDATGLGARAFEVSANSGTVTLNGLTVEHGAATDQGGGILFSGTGTLNLTNDVITANAVNAPGTATAIYGGGISVDAAGTLNLVDSTVSNNTATTGEGGVDAQQIDGGGIATRLGTVNVRSSTISGNLINGDSGDDTPVIGSGGLGGGIANVSGILHVSDSTIASNIASGGMGGDEGIGGSAGGGGIYSNATTTVRSTTIAFNFAHALAALFGFNPGTTAGGGFDNGASSQATIADTIIAKNQTERGTGGQVADDVATSAAINDQGGNLIGVGVAGNFTATKDQSGTAATPLDPLFTSTIVQNNGGPTNTLLPGAGSPAIDQGVNAEALDADGATPLSTDQRGRGRIFNGTVDVGAVETQPTQSDIDITKADNESPNAVPGSQITYTVTVNNLGPDDSGPEIQTLLVSGSSGTFTLTFEGQTTSALAFNASSTDIKLALNGLSTIGGAAGFAIVTTLSTGSFLVTFGGNLVGNQPQITAAGSGGATVNTGTQLDGATTEVVDTLPSAVSGVSWAATQTGGASGFSASGTGNIDQFITDLPVGAAVTYTITGTIASSASGSLTNTATANTTAFDTNSANNSATVTDTFPTSQLAITKTDHSIAPAGDAIPGTAITYVIVASNSGAGSSPSTTITDNVPTNITSDSYTVTTSGTVSGATAGTGNINESIVLSANSSVTYTMVANIASSATGVMSNTATLSGSVAPSQVVPNGPSSSPSATDTVTLIPSADMSVVKTGPGTAIAGGSISYTVTITNNGPSDAAGVVMSDMIPAGLDSASASVHLISGADAFTAGLGGTVTETANSTIASGSQDVFGIQVNLNSNDVSGSIISNTATVATTTTDPNTTNNTSSTVTTTISTQTDLSVTKTAPASATAGAAITYTVTVTNNGPSDAQGVSLSDAVPTGEKFVSVAVPAGWTRTDSTAVGGTGTLTFTDATLAMGASGVFTIVDQTPSSAVSGATLSNTATVSTATTDTNSTNNSATVTSTVATAADISVVQTGPSAAVAGTDVTYTITIHNNGPSDSPSEGLEVVSSAGLSNTMETLVSGPDLLSTLPAGGTSVFTFTAHVDADDASGSQVSNEVDVNGVITDPNLMNNSSTVTTNISTQADLSVVKTGPLTASPGQNLTYFITTTNNGPSDAANVFTNDTIPLDTTLFSFAQATGPNNGGDLPAGGTETFTLILKTDPAATDGTQLTDTAQVSTDTTDPNSTNNSSSVTTTLHTDADLSVTKTGPATAVEGAEITYTVTVTDNGPADASNVSVVDQLPSGAFFDSEFELSGPSATSADPASGSTGGNITWTLSSLANGSSATFLVFVNGDEGTIVNNVTATTTTTDSNLTNNAASASTMITDAPLTGNAATTLLGTEGADTGPLNVATFTDAYGNSSGDPDGAAAFTATITWGDGNTSLGTITQSTTNHNLYTVTGDNTFAEEGLYKVTVHIADEGGSTTDVTEQALIVDAPLTANPGTDFTAVEGQKLINQVVATFTDADPNGAIGDYVANIDWGDGVASAASFVAAGVDGNGDPIFNVIGTHTYHEEGNYTATVAIQDAGSGTFATEVVTVSDPAVVPVAGPEIDSVEGQSTGPVLLATFTDPGGAEPNKFDPDPVLADHYTASVDWGDGTPVDNSATITFDSSTGVFSVTGTHTYAEESFSFFPYPPFFSFDDEVTVTIHHESAPDASVTDFADVSDPAVIAQGGFSFTGSEGSDTGPLTLATFTDPGGAENITDYSASVDWGDGTPIDNSATIVDEGGGVFGVSDNHTYAEESTTANPYKIKVTVNHDVAPASNTVTDTIKVTDPSVIGAPVPITGVEGAPTGSIAVATFTDPAGPEILGDYAPTINWGDGTATTNGTLSYNAATQTFTVKGNHTYKEESDPDNPSHDPYQVTVTIHHETSIPTVVNTTAFIADPAVIGTGVSAINAKKGTSTGSITLANFTDPGGAETASDYSATINWGDGSSPANGTIVLSGGKLSVTGSHTYNATGTFHPTIVIHHETAPDSNTVTDTVNVPANSLTTTGVNVTGNEGRNITATVANFVSGNSAAVIGNFSASINWGDGKTSTGTIVKDSTGHFHVTGTHAYAEESTGSGYTVKTTITEAGGSTVVASSLAKIADSPLDTPAGLSLSKSVNVSFTNLVLGSFRDQDALNTMGTDYTGTITWGDGTTSAAGFVFKSATSNVGSFWSVTGSHKYTTKKTFAVKIVLHDNGSPTKTITINTTIKIS